MNSGAANSAGFARPAPPPPQIEIEILLPDGSCIPATPANARKVLKQARTELLKSRKARRLEIAAELQQNLEDRAAARRLLDELAQYDRDHRRRMAAVLRAKVKPEAQSRDASPVRKRRRTLRSGVVNTPLPTSSWVVDDMGMRGVSYHQSYLNRKSLAFYLGAARDCWYYDARDEAVMRDEDGNVIWFSNLGHDIDEVGAAWQAIEDATTRKNGKVQIRIIVPLDADASPAEKAEALRLFCETVLAPLDIPYSAVIHHAPEGGDLRNDHGHILLNLRPTEHVAPYSWAFADEIRGELDGKNGVQMLRHLWAHAMSEAAERSGRNMRYTGLSYAARGLDLDAGEHLGEDRSAMVARGETVWAHERNRIRNARNAQRMILRDLDRKMAALTRLRDTLIADRQEVGRAPCRLVVAAAAKAGRPASLQAAGNPAGRRQCLDAAVSVSRESTERRRMRHATSDRAGPFNVRRGAVDGRDQSVPPLVSAVTTRAGSSAAQRLIPVGSTGQTSKPCISVESDVRPPSEPLHSAARSPSTARPPFHVAAQGRTSGDRQVMISATVARRAERSAIVDTMQELLRQRAATRSAKAADPGIAAARRRRELAEDDDRRRAATVITERLWLELNPGTASTRTARAAARQRDRATLDRIAGAGGYVSARVDGILIQAVREGIEPPSDDQWWAQRHVQHALIDLRRRQQDFIEAALRTPRTDLVSMSRDRPLTWGAYVLPAHRECLDRWAEVPTFRRDVRAIARRLSVERNGQGAAAGIRQSVQSAPAPASRIADGLGGWRDTPPPVFTGVTPPVRVRAFMRDTDQPSDHLLRLLLLVARHPHAIEVASDGRLMTTAKRPAFLAPLLHSWRHDDRVAALVTDTVRLSREAGQPTWPVHVAAQARAFAAKEAAASQDHGRAAPRSPSKPRFDPRRPGGNDIG